MIALKPVIGPARFFILVPMSLGVALYALNWFWYLKILKVLFQGKRVEENKTTDDANEKT